MHVRYPASKDTTSNSSEVADDSNQKLYRKRNTLQCSTKVAIVMTLAIVFAGLFLFQYKEESSSSSEPTTEHSSSSADTKSTAAAAAAITIPPCDSTPWKPDEDMVGTCPGIRTVDKIATAQECAEHCCANKDCITWQFRLDKGCLQTGDVRIGMEKDGPSAYCSDHPPLRWQGQFVKNKDDKANCSIDTWDPHSQQGQCFGLGDVRKGIASAEDCMKACCDDEQCGAWQFHASLGCFYGKSMFSCQKSDDPIVFEPFVGRRKFQNDRTYSGPERASV